MNGICGRCQLLLNCVLWCVTQAVLITSVGWADDVISTSASTSTNTESNDDALKPCLGIEALKPYSDLSHLPLEMTESELMSLTYYQGYSPKRIRRVIPVQYELRMHDKHILIFTFEEKGGKCSSIQRVLDERWVLAPPSNLSWASARHDLAQTGVAGTKVSDKIAQRWDRKLHWLASSTSAGVNVMLSSQKKPDQGLYGDSRNFKFPRLFFAKLLFWAANRVLRPSFEFLRQRPKEVAVANAAEVANHREIGIESEWIEHEHLQARVTRQTLIRDPGSRETKFLNATRFFFSKPWCF